MLRRPFFYSCLLCLCFGMFLVGCGGLYYVECRSNGDCSDGKVCAVGYCRTSGQTTTTCGLDGSCETGYSCSQGLCTPNKDCNDGKVCPAGYSCIGTSAGMCVKETNSCTTDTNCGKGYICSEGTCTQACNCKAGETCTNGRCETQKQTEVCTPTVQNISGSHFPSANASKLIYSPDGKMLAVFRNQNSPQRFEVRLRDTETGTIKGILFPKPSSWVLFHPTSRQLLIVGEKVELWDLDTIKQVRQFDFVKESIWDVRYSPSGKYILVQTKTKTVLWDSTTFKPQLELPKSDRYASLNTLTADEATLVIFNQTRIINRVNVNDATATSIKLAGLSSSDKIYTHSLSPNGTIAAAFVNDSIYVWDAKDGSLQYKIGQEALGMSLGYVRSIIFDASGKHMVAAASGMLFVWSTTSGQLIRSRAGYSNQLVFAKEPQTISGTTNRGVFVWKFGTEQAPIIHDTGESASTATFSNTLQQWAIATKTSSPPSARISFWNLDQQTVNKNSFNISETYDTPATYQSVGNTLVTFNQNGVVRYWQQKDGVLEVKSDYLSGWKQPENTSKKTYIAPSGKHLVITNYNQQTKEYTVKLWDLIARSPSHTLYKGSSKPIGMAFRADGKTMASTFYKDHRIVIWELSSGKKIFETNYYTINQTLHKSGRPTGTTKRIYALALSADGNYMVSVVEQAGKGFDMWKLTDQKPFFLSEDTTFFAGKDIWRMTYSPDQKYITMVINAHKHDSSIALFDTKTGRHIRSFEQEGLFDVEFRSDSQAMIGISSKKSVMWDVNNEKVLLTLHNVESGESPSAIRFSPSGAELAVINTNGILRLWTCP